MNTLYILKEWNKCRQGGNGWKYNFFFIFPTYILYSSTWPGQKYNQGNITVQKCGGAFISNETRN